MKINVYGDMNFMYPTKEVVPENGCYASADPAPEVEMEQPEMEDEDSTEEDPEEHGVLARHCRRVDIPIITIHGLRHTHASLLLFAGVSIASVARRLGHSSMTTTQKTYLHIIQELENQDIDLVMRALSNLS